MQIRAEEISSIIKQQISDYDRKVDVAETGTVISVGDGIARIYGLRGAMAGELLDFPGDVRGLVLNLDSDSVGVAIMGHDVEIKEGDTVKRTGQIASVPVGEAMLGRVVDGLGRPIDGLGEVATSEYRRIELKAPGILAPRSVAANASSSSATARPARPPSPSTRSSTRRAATCTASTSPSARSSPRWRRWSTGSKTTAP
jgi:F-type H+-transporting ATPase subunit alpha